MNQRANGRSQGNAAGQLRCQQTRMAVAPRPATAPPVYRPQPLPKVLQTKTAGGVQAHAAQASRQPVPAPVYRSQQAAQALQPKTAHPTQQHRQPPVAAPVYRPQPVPKVLQTKTAGGGQPQTARAPRKPVAPPVYRPQAKPVGVQAKMAGTKSAQLQGRGVIQRGQNSSSLSKGSGGGGKKPPPSYNNNNNNNNNDDDIPNLKNLKFDQVAAPQRRTVPRLLPSFDLPPNNQAKWNFGQDEEGERKYRQCEAIIAALNELRDYTNARGLVIDPLGEGQVDQILQNTTTTGGVSSDYHRGGAGPRRQLYVEAGAAGYDINDAGVRNLLDRVIALYHSYYYTSIVSQTGILI